MELQEFEGFKPGVMKFLRELDRNNERQWFNANKQRYESEVVAPAMAFIEAMAPRLEAVSPHFLAIPRKIGGSMMRVYRDTRFSADKRPYKTNIGIQFRHELGRDVHAPGFYVHLEPGSVFLGVGLWHPGSEELGKIRRHIDRQQGDWKKARDGKKFSDQFALGGESLKRAPRGYAEDHPLIGDLKRKDFIAARDVAVKETRDSGFVDLVGASFRSSAPFMRFLCDALEVPF
jgi:uncharacterized protein (TIGR02453 family)